MLLEFSSGSWLSLSFLILDSKAGNRVQDVKEVMMEEKLRTAFELLFEETTASTTELVKIHDGAS